MNKTITEKPETKPVAKPPQSKRYEEAFKKQAVENWLQSGKPGTHRAEHEPPRHMDLRRPLRARVRDEGRAIVKLLAFTL